MRTGSRARVLLQRLVNKLWKWGRNGLWQRREAAFDLRALLIDVPQIIAPALSKTVSVKTDLGEKPVLVKADKSDLMRIVSNLILNAADALGEVEGLVEIALRQETLIPPERHSLANCWPGGNMRKSSCEIPARAFQMTY